MKNYRERYLAEIVDQHDNFITPWLALLGVDRTQRWVLTLVQTALRIGELVVMFYKDKYARPRPSHVCPTLAPPFGPPGHPSFPSGHALQGHLVAHCLTMMTRVQTNDDPNTPIYDYPWEGQIFWLANRIALNREYAGLHFPSDTVAGIWLAERCFEILAETGKFQQLMGDAIEHWKGA
jgi:acid phosphatase (class A)